MTVRVRKGANGRLVKLAVSVRDPYDPLNLKLSLFYLLMCGTVGSSTVEAMVFLPSDVGNRWGTEESMNLRGVCTGMNEACEGKINA